jgi:hypothetical protein
VIIYTLPNWLQGKYTSLIGIRQCVYFNWFSFCERTMIIYTLTNWLRGKYTSLITDYALRLLQLIPILRKNHNYLYWHSLVWDNYISLTADWEIHLLECSSVHIFCLATNTIKSVFKGHSAENQKVVFKSRCALFTCEFVL